MTLSELNALMTGGFATVAGSVLAVYMGLLGPDLAPHLLTASVMSAPAAFVVAKLIRPETEEPATGRSIKLRIGRTANNVIEAAAAGTQDGLKLYLNVVAMLIAFMALINLVDWPLGFFGEIALSMPREPIGETPADPLSLARLFGWILAPLAWCMGVQGWHDCQLFGSLIGTKLAVTELIAFSQLVELRADQAFAHERTAKMAAYALCGFANFASIGIQMGGITPLAPDRRADLARLALRAMLGGAIASAMTATIAGMFLR
jgi:CNT family concentrative nucleoside transporter